MGALKQALTALHTFERRTVRRQGLVADLGAAAVNLFRVAGAVQIHLMFGHVTTACDATANTLRHRWTPTVGVGPVWLNAASASIATDAINTIYVWSGAIAGQLVPGGLSVGYIQTELIPWAGNTLVLMAGVIDMVIGGGAAAVPGVIDWYILFTPMTGQSDIIVM